MLYSHKIYIYVITAHANPLFKSNMYFYVILGNAISLAKIISAGFYVRFFAEINYTC